MFQLETISRCDIALLASPGALFAVRLPLATRSRVTRQTVTCL
jgi:hypothetical protein